MEEFHQKRPGGGTLAFYRKRQIVRTGTLRMTERLGFNDTLLLVVIGGIAAFALGVALVDSIRFMENDADSRDARRNLTAAGTLFKDLGAIAVGLGIVLAAVRAEGHSTAMRAVM